MPGSGRCARCGGMLALAAAAISVHPPRANRLERTMPRLWGRVWSRAHNVDGFVRNSVRPIGAYFAQFGATDFTWPTMLRCIVPGLAQRYRGNADRGRMFFIAYLGLLIPALIFFGTTLGGILIGLAFALHIASASDALVKQFASIGERLALSAICALAIGLFVYLPIGAAASRVVSPIHLTQDLAPFFAGDVLWYRPITDVHAGEFIVHSIPQMSLVGMNNHTRYLLNGRWVSRVAAIGGQHVIIKDGKLTVDGQPSNLNSASGAWGNIDSDLVVPENAVFVSSPAVVPVEARFDVEAWRRLSVVQTSDIRGRIVFRSQPLWRISTIQAIADRIE